MSTPEFSTLEFGGAEKRRYRRYPVSIGAWLAVGDVPRLPCTIRDFSSRGMLIDLATSGHELPGPLEPGCKLALGFDLAGLVKRARAGVRLVREERTGTTWRIAVSFPRCNPSVLDALLRLAESQGSRLPLTSTAAPACRAPPEVRARDGEFRPERALVEAIHGVLMHRASAEGCDNARYFYALIAFRGVQQGIEQGLARLLDRQPARSLDEPTLVEAVGRISRSSNMDHEVHALFLEALESCAATCLEKASLAA